jgi:hypothetical protein
MKSFPYLPLVVCGILTASTLTGCGTGLGDLKPGPVLPVAATPTYSPASGTFTTPQTVTITDATAGATIYYTTDGTIPSQLSPVYTGPIKVIASKTISAIAVAAGQVQSQIGYGMFNIAIPAPKYTFQNVAIVGGGFVDGVFFHPGQQGLMYARTDVGGAYRYLVGTDTQWTPLTDFVTSSQGGTLLGVESLGLDPSDPKRLYLSMGEYDGSSSPDGEFELSDDQGMTFTQVNAPFKMGANENGRFAGERFGVDPQLGTNIWYGSRDSGLYESTDRGMTWTQNMGFPVTMTTGTAADPGAGVIFETFIKSSGTVSGGGTKTFYVGVSDPTTGLYVTNDGGVTFTPVAGQPTGQYPNSNWLSASDGNLYITYSQDAGCSSACTSVGPQGVTAGSVWKYTLPTNSNPAGTWTNITPPNPGAYSYGYSSVVVDPNNPSVIMVTTLDHYFPAPGDDIYRSTDGGNTWESLETNANRDSSLSPWVNFGQPTPGPGNWLNHLAVDPFNSAHAMYGDGQTIWQTTDITAADGVTTNASTIVPANPTNWSIGAVGIEETVINGLASPPAVTPGGTPPNELISVMDDLGGFSFPEAVIESGKSPANGADKNPELTSGTSVDYAYQNPLVLARVGTNNGGSQFGGYSTDGGQTWNPFASNPTGVVNGGGSVAVSADGSTILWISADGGSQVSYSNDNGTTWTAATGAPTQSAGNPQILLYADRNTPLDFYLLNPQNGQVSASTDGGHTFIAAQNAVQGAISLAVSPAATGDIWAATSTGLQESLDGGTTFTAVNPVTSPSVVGEVTSAIAIGFGAPDSALQITYPAIYLSGAVEEMETNPTTQQPYTTAEPGVYRSVDQGATWQMINNSMQEWGGVYQITGDPNIFARVYMGTAGRGILYGDSPN